MQFCAPACTLTIRLLLFKDYNDKNLRHDIALVKLEESLDFDAAINAVCLPERPLEVGEGMEIAGWGNTETGNGAWVTKKVRCLPVLLQYALPNSRVNH